MNLSFLLRGIIIGFSIAAPVGPIGILGIRRTLAEGRTAGLVTGLGAATADAVYGCIAGFGLTFVSNFLVSQQVWIRLIGGAFLCHLGLKTFLARPAETAAAAEAPVGPIGILGIRRTLAEGRTAGLVTGLGAATADAVYGCIAGFGLTFVSNFLVSQQVWIRLIGGAFLCHLGLKTFLARPAETAAAAESNSLVGAYASTFLLTLTNPTTILSFVTIFAGLGVASAGGSYTDAAILVLGVFTGSALWWFILSFGVSVLRSKFKQILQWVNRISGIILMVFGVIALVNLRG